MHKQPESEIICVDPVTRQAILIALLGAKAADPSEACLLGHP